MMDIRYEVAEPSFAPPCTLPWMRQSQKAQSILLGTKPACICCSGKVLLSLASNKGASGWLKKHIFGSQNKSRLSSRSLSGIDSDDSIDTRGSPLSMVRLQCAGQNCRQPLPLIPVLGPLTLQGPSPSLTGSFTSDRALTLSHDTLLLKAQVDGAAKLGSWDAPGMSVHAVLMLHRPCSHACRD